MISKKGPFTVVRCSPHLSNQQSTDLNPKGEVQSLGLFAATQSEAKSDKNHNFMPQRPNQKNALQLPDISGEINRKRKIPLQSDLADSQSFKQIQGNTYNVKLEPQENNEFAKLATAVKPWKDAKKPLRYGENEKSKVLVQRLIDFAANEIAARKVKVTQGKIKAFVNESFGVDLATTDLNYLLRPTGRDPEIEDVEDFRSKLKLNPKVKLFKYCRENGIDATNFMKMNHRYNAQSLAVDIQSTGNNTKFNHLNTVYGIDGPFIKSVADIQSNVLSTVESLFDNIDTFKALHDYFDLNQLKQILSHNGKQLDASLKSVNIEVLEKLFQEELPSLGIITKDQAKMLSNTRNLGETLNLLNISCPNLKKLIDSKLFTINDITSIMCNSFNKVVIIQLLNDLSRCLEDTTCKNKFHSLLQGGDFDSVSLFKHIQQSSRSGQKPVQEIIHNMYSDKLMKNSIKQEEI
jgi:hypothetical protein